MSGELVINGRFQNQPLSGVQRTALLLFVGDRHGFGILATPPSDEPRARMRGVTPNERRTHRSA